MQIAQPGTPVGSGEPSGERFGMTVRPLTPARARQLGLDPDTRGLVVANIDPAGLAADAGLRQGDVILQVDGQPVTTTSALRSALGNAVGRPALLLVNRGGNTFYVALRTA